MKIACCLVMASFTLMLNAQNATALLNVNNVKAWFKNDGTFFNNSSGNVGFIVPQSGTAGTIFLSSIWIGGIDPGGALHLAAQTYRQSGSDFWSGPLDFNGMTDSTTKNDWDKIWKVSRADINAHIADYSDGFISSPITSIFEWPATGNIYARGKNDVFLSLTNRYMAPFIDIDSNGIYEPDEGDYPDIKGDEMLWYVINDNLAAHPESGGRPFPVEVRVSAYSYSSSYPPLNNTVFVSLKFISFSFVPYHSAYFGNFIDFDIGCHTNDYVGCDTSVNSFYAYNGTATDPDCATKGYGSNHPIQSVTFLDRKMSSFRYYNNDNSATGNPSDSTSYYRYLSGKWKDGSQMTYGGTGYGAGTPTLHMFPGNPSNSAEWSECSINSIPADRRGLGIFGPFDLFPGQVFNINLAYTAHFLPPTSYPCPDYAVARQEIDSLTSLFTSGALDNDSLLSTIVSYDQSGVNIYPIPASDHLIIEWGNEQVSFIELFNTIGQRIAVLNVNSENSIKISLRDFQNGIYLLKFQGQSLSFVKKIEKS